MQGENWAQNTCEITQVSISFEIPFPNPSTFPYFSVLKDYFFFFISKDLDDDSLHFLQLCWCPQIYTNKSNPYTFHLSLAVSLDLQLLLKQICCWNFYLAFLFCCYCILWKDWCLQRLLSFKSLGFFSVTISDDGALTVATEPLQGVPDLPELSELSAHPFASAATSSAPKTWRNKGRPKPLGFPSTL